MWCIDLCVNSELALQARLPEYVDEIRAQSGIEYLELRAAGRDKALSVAR
jgi:hypothetical protein